VSLAISGGLFELAGLALVAIEIRGDRELAEKYLNAHPIPTGPLSPFRRLRDPRLDQLRSGDPRYRTEQQERDLETATGAAERTARDQQEAFLNFVRELLQGGLGRRKLGALLLAVGIVLSVGGSIVSTAC
jgi:hypothetical protein